MRDLIALTLSVAVPWLAGTLFLRAADRTAQLAPGISIGYGYLIGLFGITLVMRALDVIGQPWSLPWVALPVVALAAGAYGWQRAAPARSPRGDAFDMLGAMPRFARGLFGLLLLLTTTRVILLALEVGWTPLLHVDALSHWAPKARVWYEYGALAPFVAAADWSKAPGAMHFTDGHPGYPGTVPLFQVWTALCLGRWDASLVNIPWVSALIALGIAFYAQLRRLGISALKTMFGTYVLLSLPFLTLHVAIAGIADIFVAIAYGLAAIAAWQWTLTRQRSDAALALVMTIICASLKVEGSLWALTLVPGVVFALNRRLGFALMLAVASIAALYVAFGPAEVRILNYTLRTQFTDVTSPVYEHLLVMDNWHVLWYAALAVIAANWRLLGGKVLAPMSVTMLAAGGFILTVFYFTNAFRGVEDESLTNRLPLHAVPALVFYLALVLRERLLRSTAANGGLAAVAKTAT